MRYVNLKKRNTSKFQYFSKRVATFSLLSLVMVSVFVVPLTMKSQFNIADQNKNVIEENLGNDDIKAISEMTFGENKL